MTTGRCEQGLPESLAARFTLTEDVVIDTAGVMNWAYGGRARFSILTDFQGLPGGRVVFTRALEPPATGLNDSRLAAPQASNRAMTQGDYWLVFEDVPNNSGLRW
ncbi:MAG: hypothetical protein IPG06_13105 [Haliea sp.]|nr:hypothetical protein [Haliea sp.]